MQGVESTKKYLEMKERELCAWEGKLDSREKVCSRIHDIAAWRNVSCFFPSRHFFYMELIFMSVSYVCMKLKHVLNLPIRSCSFKIKTNLELFEYSAFRCLD